MCSHCCCSAESRCAAGERPLARGAYAAACDARGPTSALALNDLRAMRATNCSGRSMQTLPWLKIGGMGDWGVLFDRGPSTYWYRVPEVEHELVDAGFEIIAVGVGSEIVLGVICKDGVELQARGAVGTIYSVCRKRECPRSAMPDAAHVGAARNRFQRISSHIKLCMMSADVRESIVPISFATLRMCARHAPVAALH